MSTNKLDSMQDIPRDRYEEIMRRLEKIYRTDDTAFCMLVKACRNPLFEIKSCRDKPDWVCRDYHRDCRQLEAFDGLIISVDEQLHAQIDPIVRAVVLAATPNPQMPKIIWPLAS